MTRGSIFIPQPNTHTYTTDVNCKGILIQNHSKDQKLTFFIIFIFLFILGISNESFYKTAIDHAKKENHPEIVKLLLKGPKQNENDDRKLKEEVKLIRKENSQLKKENSILNDKVQKLENENKTYEKFILSLKKKISILPCNDQNKNEEESSS